MPADQQGKPAIRRENKWWIVNYEVHRTSTSEVIDLPPAISIPGHGSHDSP